MAHDAQPAVAFLFFSGGKDWQGGTNYYRSLLGALDALPDRGFRLVVLLGNRTDAKGLHLPASAVVIRDTCLDRFSWKWFTDKLTEKLIGRRIFLSRLLLRNRVRVISHIGPMGTPRVKTIGWIPDFQHVSLPSFFPPEELTSRDLQFRNLLALCDLVVLSSQAAQDDLAQFSPEHAYKGRILRFCAVRPNLTTESTQPDVRKIYGLVEPYFYLPNQVWAHKNHAVVIEALALLKVSNPAIKVVCSGALSDYRNPDHVHQLNGRVGELGLSDQFLLLGLIPYEHIAPLMLHSVAVINPSFFEGWSTTVEEAKALGVPLILSNLKVHQEQCTQGEATFFDPNDPAGLATRMTESLAEASTQAGDEIRMARLTAALERHHERSISIAGEYRAIVNELL